MKSQLIRIFLLVLIGFLPIQAFSQVVLPPAAVVQHYKDQSRRIQSHAIHQTTVLGTGDTLFQSYPSLIDSAVSWSFIQWTKATSGFPLGNNLTKLNNGQWRSSTADGIALNWDFSDSLNHQTTVYLDSSNHLTIQLIDTASTFHFAQAIDIWKYKLISTGPLFSWLLNKEIWLSPLGILQCPDFRAFPYEKEMLILTGYDSPTIKKGLTFSDSTYAPHQAGDSIRFYISDAATTPPYYPWTWYYEVIELVSLISTNTHTQDWLAHKSIYTPDANGSVYLLDTLILNDTINLDILPTDGRHIISFDGQNKVVHLFDSLSFNNNPDRSFQRTYAHTYKSNGAQYYQFAQGTGSMLDEFGHTDFRGDWGFNSFILRGKTGNNYPYFKQSIVCDYRTVGNRRLGNVAMATSLPETPLSNRQLLSYPNPATQQLNILDEDMNDQRVHIRIYDSRGSLMKQIEATFPLQLDVSEFNAGLYFASITGTNGYVRYSRFVKVNP